MFSSTKCNKTLYHILSCDQHCQQVHFSCEARFIAANNHNNKLTIYFILMTEISNVWIRKCFLKNESSKVTCRSSKPKGRSYVSLDFKRTASNHILNFIFVLLGLNSKYFCFLTTTMIMMFMLFICVRFKSFDFNLISTLLRSCACMFLFLFVVLLQWVSPDPLCSLEEEILFHV